MTLRSIATAALAFAFLIFPNRSRCAPRRQSDTPENFRKLSQEIANLSPDPCGPPYAQVNWDSTNVESQLLDRAAEIVTDGLNATQSNSQPPRDRAAAALRNLEEISAETDAAWPDENRFHFQILDLPPALVVKMTIRMHDKFYVYGVPAEDSGKPNHSWNMVGSDDETDEAGEHDVPAIHIDLYPLQRGPSANARFLAVFGLFGCAGSNGIAYDAREWNPQGIGSLDQIIEQSGAFGLDDKVPSFQRIGKLQTEGSRITLPYCWFSAIDTWDNPSLCAADTYDLSGDSVKFISRAYNRPDLVPVAKAIEYAQKRDHEAVEGYCASSDVAGRLVRDTPPFIFAGELHVTRTGIGKEHVEFGDGPAYHFDVEKRGARWLIASFTTE
jgi:hypothetical protein